MPRRTRARRPTGKHRGVALMDIWKAEATTSTSFLSARNTASRNRTCTVQPLCNKNARRHHGVIHGTTGAGKAILKLVRSNSRTLSPWAKMATESQVGMKIQNIWNHHPVWLAHSSVSKMSWNHPSNVWRYLVCLAPGLRSPATLCESEDRIRSSRVLKVPQKSQLHAESTLITFSLIGASKTYPGVFCRRIAIKTQLDQPFLTFHEGAYCQSCVCWHSPHTVSLQLLQTPLQLLLEKWNRNTHGVERVDELMVFDLSHGYWMVEKMTQEMLSAVWEYSTLLIK